MFIATIRVSRFALIVLTAVAVLGRPSDASAQQVDVEARLASRAELQGAVTSLDRWAASSAYSVTTRNRARSAASAGRARLANGDFRVGDQILLRVEGALMIDDTITVRAGPAVTIPGLTEVPLAGVLRSELNDRLTTAVREVQRTATVLARPLIRVAVFGQVSVPGFYMAPGEATLDRLISQAGGPAVTADPAKAELRRGDDVLLDRFQVVSSIASGVTLDDLGLRDGDAVHVPARRQPWDRQMTMQIATLVLAPVIAAFLVGAGN